MKESIMLDSILPGGRMVAKCDVSPGEEEFTEVDVEGCVLAGEVVLVVTETPVMVE